MFGFARHPKNNFVLLEKFLTIFTIDLLKLSLELVLSQTFVLDLLDVNLYASLKVKHLYFYFTFLKYDELY